MSFGGALGGLARDIVTNYQAEAKDPACVYSRRSSMRPKFSSSTHRPRPADLQPLGPGSRQERRAGRALLQFDGHGSDPLGQDRRELLVQELHRPTLGNQAPLIQELQLNGQIDNAESLTNNFNQSKHPCAAGQAMLEPIVSTDRRRSCRVTSPSFPVRPRRLD